jgi:hypothetical protein
MGTGRISSLVVVGLALAAGCGPNARPPQTPEQLMGRLDAANRITNLSERQAALKEIAVDAANSGAGDITLKAMERITNVSTKNEVAEECALTLARRGDTRAATTCAEAITNVQKKNEVLARIAKGR